jgi:hypothetical protein
MAFSVNDDVCVLVPPQGDSVADRDVGDIKNVLPLNSYDVFRRNMGSLNQHSEGHIFMLREGEKRPYQYTYSGYKEIITFTKVLGIHYVESKIYTRNGRRLFGR